MISLISSLVTPLASARAIWPRSCCGRYKAVKVATVIRLRSRLDSPGRSHTSPKTTFSVSSMSLGTIGRSFSLGSDDDGAAIVVPPLLRQVKGFDGAKAELHCWRLRRSKIDSSSGPNLTHRGVSSLLDMP